MRSDLAMDNAPIVQICERLAELDTDFDNLENAGLWMLSERGERVAVDQL